MKRKITVEVEIEVDGKYCSFCCAMFDDRFDDDSQCNLYFRKLNRTKSSKQLRCKECLEATK